MNKLVVLDLLFILHLLNVFVGEVVLDIIILLTKYLALVHVGFAPKNL